VDRTETRTLRRRCGAGVGGPGRRGGAVSARGW